MCCMLSLSCLLSSLIISYIFTTDHSSSYSISLCDTLELYNVRLMTLAKQVIGKHLDEPYRLYWMLYLCSEPKGRVNK